MSIAPNLGLILSGTIGNQNVFLIAGGLSAASVVCCLFLKNTSASVPDPVAHEAKPFRIQSLFAVDLLLLALISGLFSLMNGVASSYLSMLGDERNIVNIGIFFTISSVAVLLIRPMTGKLFDRRGLTVILVPCLIFGSCAMICTGLAGSIGVIVVAALLKGFAKRGAILSAGGMCPEDPVKEPGRGHVNLLSGQRPGQQHRCLTGRLAVRRLWLWQHVYHRRRIGRLRFGNVCNSAPA